MEAWKVRATRLERELNVTFRPKILEMGLFPPEDMGMRWKHKKRGGENLGN